MDKSEKWIGYGVLGVALAGVVLVVLKLCGVIAWTWWIVLLPVFILAAMLVLSAVVVVVSAYRSGRIW